jgi:hypothetical protein
MQNVKNETRFAVKATMGMVLGKTLYFNEYQDASDFAHMMCEGQPVGKVEVVNPKGITCWSYERSKP